MTYDNPREQQAHETMSTDQRLAVLLTAQVQNLGSEKKRLEREHDAYTDAAMKEALTRQLGHISRAYDRLVFITEALAGGTLFFMDEYKMVKALEDSFDADRKYIAAGTNDPHYSPLRVAQLAIQNLKETGALR